LLMRLDKVGAEQQNAARQKLAANPETQSLLDEAQKILAADPTRDPRPCFAAPTVACLTKEAIGTATAIHRPHFRDWVFGEIATVQARAGRPLEARRSAGRISDPRLIIAALGNIAKAQAGNGELESALESAGIIPDIWARADALVAVAIAQSHAGAWPEARETAQEIQRLLTELPDDRPHIPLLGRLAKGLYAAGDVTVSKLIIDRHRTGLESNVPRSQQIRETSAPHRALAVAYADLDLPDAALSLISDKKNDDRDRSAYLALSKALARAGDDHRAGQMVVRLSEARYRAVGWTNVAHIQNEAGRFMSGHQSLLQAEIAARQIEMEKSFARAHALKGIAEAWIGVNELERAKKTAEIVPNPALRGMVWRLIAVAHDRRNEAEKAVAAKAAAVRAAEAVNSPLDRVWHFTNVAISLSAAGNSEPAREAFMSALGVAETMSSVWARAQALARLAGALISLSQAPDDK